MRLRVCLVVLTVVAGATADEPLTVAEKSDFTATSRHADVTAFCEALAAKSPVVRFTDMGTSGEGRKIPLLILADPPIRTPAEAKAGGKLVVYVQANIHAGEVDGKEGLLMLARDIALGSDRALLRHLVLLFCPNFNPDGNERIDARNRRSQNGPRDGVGIRANAAGFDLNRDFVKLETPEVQAFVRIMNEWDPAIAIDCHTTNGSYHRYLITYDGPRHPNCGAALIETVRDKCLPDVGERLERRTGFKSFPYGNFSRDKSRWETYGQTPRYSTQYVGLRGRIGILSESYSYAPYKDRITASREFVRAWLEYAAAHADEIRRLLATNHAGDLVAVRTNVVPLRTATALGYEEETKDGRRVPLLDKPRDHELQLVTRVEPAERAPLPSAYLFPASYATAAENLRRHGVIVEQLAENQELDVEVYRIDTVTQSETPFQKHRETTVQIVRGENGAGQQRVRRALPGGTIVVRTAQPLGMLAAYLLEPRSEDGLTTWNFFDAGLKPGEEFPVMRLVGEPRLKLRAARERETTGPR